MEDHEWQPLSQAKAACASHQCPKCGSIDVTVERLLAAGTSVTQCHCRVCDHSWAPDVTAS